MITVEIMMIICFVLYGFALYIMYRYFNDVIDGMYDELNDKLEAAHNMYKIHSDLCKSYTDQLNDRMKSLENNMNKLENEFNTRLDKIVEIVLETKSKLNPEIQKPKTRKIRKENND